ncbi:MAG: hypothetical protein ACK4GO_05380 [Gemmobacter sp.]
MAEARIVLNLPARHLEDWRQVRHLRVHARIAEVLEPVGARIVALDRRLRRFEGGAEAAGDYADGDLHVIETGRVQGPGVLNAALAYLPPFWHLDPAGVQAESGIGARAYDPETVRLKPAMAFLDRMQAKWVLPRRSRRGQEEAVADLPRGALAVFLQGDFAHLRGLAHASAEAMLTAVAAGAGGRAVLVKPHPLAAEHVAPVIARVLAAGWPVRLTTANVHDILAACAATVSFNSAVALEGFLHRKPAILFGRSDFHQYCETVTDPARFPQALARCLARPPGGYGKFLYWYLAQQCLNVESPSFPARLLAILTQAGFPPDRLGLHGAPDGGAERGEASAG